MANKQMTFVAAMRDYFGYKTRPDGTPGTAGDFLQELKALTPEDKEYFKKNLATVGYDITNA